MSEPVTFIIPGELISSKNSRKPIMRKSKTTGKTKIIPVKSDVAKADEERLLSLLQANNDFAHAWSKEIVSRVMSGGWPLIIKFMIYRKTDRRFDYSNITQNLFDCLVKSGLLPDDDSKHVIPAYKPYRVDGRNTRTEITIESI